MFDLLAELKRQPSYGRTPTRTLIYGYTFEPGLSPRYDAGVREFQALFGLTDTSGKPAGSGPPRDYIDVRGQSVEKLEEYCRKLGDRARQIAVVSLGDEISLPQPQAAQANEEFRRWLAVPRRPAGRSRSRVGRRLEQAGLQSGSATEAVPARTVSTGRGGTCITTAFKP